VGRACSWVPASSLLWTTDFDQEQLRGYPRVRVSRECVVYLWQRPHNHGCPSGITSFIGACQANVSFTIGHECFAVFCGVAISFLTGKEGYTTDPGNVQGATSYSMTCTTSGNLSKTSDGCGLFDPMEIHYGVSDGSGCTGRVCCAGYSVSEGSTFLCGHTGLNFTGCDTSINYNLYTSSIMVYNLYNYRVTVLDIDCFDVVSGACETIDSKDSYTRLQGDNVRGCQVFPVLSSPHTGFVRSVDRSM